MPGGLRGHSQEIAGRRPRWAYPWGGAWPGAGPRACVHRAMLALPAGLRAAAAAAAAAGRVVCGPLPCQGAAAEAAIAVLPKTENLSGHGCHADQAHHPEH